MKYAEYCQQIEHLKKPLEVILEDLKTRPVDKYAVIVHDKDENEDGTPKEKHLHCFMALKSDQTPDNIAKWFNDEPQYIEKGHKKTKTYENMISYGLHETESADGKHHYDVAEYTANFDVAEFIDKVRNGVKDAKTRKERKEEVDAILNDICENKIPRIRIHEHLTNLEQIHYRADIETAYKIRDSKLATKEDRQMNVIYIQGDAGTGKTTLAKYFGKSKGYSVFVSGSSNDPLEGYQGQECVVLDDIRGSDWKINDLLKLLDNHTNSLVKSRYSNKLLIDCKLMILTSVQDIEDLYHNLGESNSEPIEQLKRRCGTMLEITADTIIPFRYDNLIKDYIKGSPMPNPVPMLEFFVNNEDVIDDLTKFAMKIQEDAKKRKEELNNGKTDK